MYMATEKKQATKIDTTLDHSLKATEGTVTPAYALTRLHLVHLGLGLRRLEENDGLRANRKRMSSYELLLPYGRMSIKGWIRPEPLIARKPHMYGPTSISPLVLMLRQSPQAMESIPKKTNQFTTPKVTGIDQC